MCGIIVYWKRDGLSSVDHSILERMTDTLEHRGPDDRGIHIKDSIGLGVRRLSIIDVLGGHQPMHGENEAIWLVFNGEIYNHRALSETLLLKSHHFNSVCDSEVIVHLFEEYGPQCVDQLDGFFSFAIWDEPEQTLFMARDRLGQKPLYYFYDGLMFLAASELKAIIDHPAVSREIDLQGVNEFLTHRYMAPPTTIFRHIHKLPAGHWLKLKDGQLSTKQYWDVPVSEPQDRLNGRDVDDLCRSIRSTLEEAVSSHLVSDVPFGALLSGGIDSSAVVGLMAHQMNQPVKTFTIGFSSASPGVDERDYARQVAQLFQTEHHEMVLEPGSLDQLLKIVWYMDDPIADPALLCTYAVTQLASQHVKMCLSGDGGDELFGGYGKHKIAWWSDRYRNLPSFVANTVEKLANHVPGMPQGVKNVIRLADSAHSDNLIQRFGLAGEVDLGRQLLSSEVIAEIDESGHPWESFYDLLTHVEGGSLVDKMLYMDTKTTLPEMFLMKSDKMSMANSLEVRMPYLDHHFVEAALSIPSELRLHRGQAKFLLKRALKDLLPKEILHRRKHYFTLPLQDWLSSEIIDDGASVLRERIGRMGIFDVQAVNRIIEGCRNGRSDYFQPYYRILILALWSEKFGV